MIRCESKTAWRLFHEIDYRGLSEQSATREFGTTARALASTLDTQDVLRSRVLQRKGVAFFGTLPISGGGRPPFFLTQNATESEYSVLCSSSKLKQL